MDADRSTPVKNLDELVKYYADLTSQDIKQEIQRLGREGILKLAKKYGAEPVTEDMRLIQQSIYDHHIKIEACKKKQIQQKEMDDKELNETTGLEDFLREKILGSSDRKKKVSLSTLNVQLLKLKENLGNPKNKEDVINVIKTIKEEKVLKSLFSQCDRRNKVSQIFIYGITNTTDTNKKIEVLQDRLIDIVTYIFNPNTTFDTQEEIKDHAKKSTQKKEDEEQNKKLLELANTTVIREEFLSTKNLIQTGNNTDVLETDTVLQRLNRHNPLLLGMVIFLTIEQIEDESERQTRRNVWKTNEIYTRAQEIIVSSNGSSDDIIPTSNVPPPPIDSNDDSDAKSSNPDLEPVNGDIYDIDMVRPFDPSSSP